MKKYANLIFVLVKCSFINYSLGNHFDDRAAVHIAEAIMVSLTWKEFNFVN